MKTKQLSIKNHTIFRVLGTIILIMCAMDINAQTLSGALSKLINTSNTHPINNYVIYEGKTKKKIPTGNGRLHCVPFDHTQYREHYDQLFTNNGNLNYQVAPTSNQDLISGVFDGNYVSNAQASFYTKDAPNWTYKGDMIVRCTDNDINYILLPKGFITIGSNNTSLIIKNTIPLVDTVVVKRKFKNFSLVFPYVKTLSNFAFKTDDPSLTFFGMPSAFFKVYTILTEVQYDKGWVSKCNATYAGLKLDQSEKITYQVENCQSSKVTFEDKSWYKILYDNSRIARVSFYAKLKDGTIKTTTDARKSSITHADIQLNNGDSYAGTIKYVSEKKGNHKVRNGQADLVPSIIETDPFFFKNLTIKDNIIFIDGVYQDAGGLSTVYEGGYDDNERLEMAQAQQARAKAAEAKAAAAQKKEAEDKSVTQTFIKGAWGKKFTFKKYQMMNQVSNGEYSVQFSQNRQDIFVRVNGRLEWLKFSNYSDDGTELVCRLWNNHSLTGTVYIKPMKREGKWALKFLYIDGLNTTYYLFN